MPGLGGNEMVRRIRTTRPDLRSCTSAVTSAASWTRARSGRVEAFCNKPFTNDGLREAVALLVYGTLKKPE